MADDDLRSLVRDELSSEPRITADADIDVSVEGGEVTLRGTVALYSDKREATNAARRVPGVTAVKDEIEMLGRTDADLRRDVLEELGIGHVPAAVDVEVHDGTVTLTGTVDRQYYHDAAAFIAKVVPGVVGVQNRIEVSGRSEDGEGDEDTERAVVAQISELDGAGVATGEDEEHRELRARLARAARRIEQLRSTVEAAGNVVQFRLERYVEALESDAIDADRRLAAISDVGSYDGKILQRELIAMESGIAAAEAKLEAAHAAERGDTRGEMAAEVRSMKVEAGGVRAQFDRTFGTKGRASDPAIPKQAPDAG